MKTKTYTPRPLDTNDVELPQELEVLVEQNGYFFRQYSIVSNGTLIPIPPKGKSQRRAICLKDNVFIPNRSLGFLCVVRQREIL